MMKTFIAQLERSAQDALADKDLGDEMLRTLCSGAKDATLVAPKEQRHQGTAGVYTAEDVFHLREERESLDRQNVFNPSSIAWTGVKEFSIGGKDDHWC